MKKSKIILFGLFVITLLSPFATIAHSAKSPGWVGIEEGKIYIWNTEFDKGPLEDFYKDLGVTDPKTREAYAISDLEWNEYEEEVTQWKMTIHEIRDEDDRFLLAPSESIADDYDYVKYVYSLKEYDGDVGHWRTINTYMTAHLWEPDEELWGRNWLDFELGIFFTSVRADNIYPSLVVPSKLDWDEVADWSLYKIKHSSTEDLFKANEIKIQHFLGKKQVGIETEYDPAFDWPYAEKELDTFESISKYNDDGILYYYEYTYDGDIIAKFELEGMVGNYVFIIENWWWLSLVAAAAVVGVIILICVIKTKKKG